MFADDDESARVIEVVGYRARRPVAAPAAEGSVLGPVPHGEAAVVEVRTVKLQCPAELAHLRAHRRDVRQGLARLKRDGDSPSKMAFVLGDIELKFVPPADMMGPLFVGG